MKDIKLYNGRYTIESEISSGGFSTVYKAREQGRRTPVALKVGKNDSDPSYSQSIRKEARLIGELKHRNIVELYPIPRKDKPAVDVTRATQLPGFECGPMV